MEANDCQWLPTHHPARVALCSPFGCAGADLSGELAVLKMAAHPSQLSQAVSVAFNLACNFPREVCKSHKQNLNAIKCGLQPVNTSLCTKLCCVSAALNYPEIKKLPNSAYSPMCYRSPHTVVTSICSLSTHMDPNGHSEPCPLQGRREKTVFLGLTHHVHEASLPILGSCPSGGSCSLVTLQASVPCFRKS